MTKDTDKAIERASRDLSNLEAQRDLLLSEAKLLSARRDQIAFAAHTGDKIAMDELVSINAKDASFAANLASLEAALNGARRNVETAKASEAKAADRDAALKLRAKAARFKELGEGLDDCFADFKSMAIEMKQLLDEIHLLGCAAPTHQQLRVLGDLAFKTAVMETPFWTQDFPFLSPAQRKSFASLTTAWHATIIANVEARLGEKKKEEAA